MVFLGMTEIRYMPRSFTGPRFGHADIAARLIFVRDYYEQIKVNLKG